MSILLFATTLVATTLNNQQHCYATSGGDKRVTREHVASE
jgi:hypothetical protein